MHDIEFDNELKLIISKLYNKYNINTNDYETYAPTNSDAEKFFLIYKSNIKQWLTKHKNYKHFGTGIWKQLPTESDIEEYLTQLTKGDL